MEFQTLLRIGLGASIGTAAVVHILVIIVLKAYRADIGFARSIKPGIIENAYKRHPNTKSLWLGALVRLCGITKLLAAAFAVVYFVLSGLER